MSTPQHNSPPPLPSDSSPTVTVSIPAPLGALGNMARERLNQITALETQLSSATEKRLRDAGDIVSHASTLPDTLAARTSALVSELEAQLSSATEARLREVTDLTSQAAAVPRTIATQASTFSNDMTAQASALTNDLAAQASALSATLASQQTSASTQVPASSNTPFGAVKTMLSHLSPVHLPQTIPAYHHPVPEGSRDILADAPAVTYAALSSPTQAARRTAETTLPAASVSSHGGGGGRVTTPPRGTARVTRSYPALPDASHPPPRPIPLPGADLLRRPTGGPYGDSDTAWQARDDREPFREKTVGERLDPTIISARTERDACAQKGKLTGFALNLAIGLQVLIGALTTALGAALSGKNTSVAISILGGASTLVASYLARTRGSNEPQFSLLRAKALSHFLREIEAFKLDHGHEIGDKWDSKIDGFRLGLESMLGNQPGSVTINSEALSSPGQEKGGGNGGGNPVGGFNGDGKYPTSAANAKLGLTVV